MSLFILTENRDQTLENTIPRTSGLQLVFEKVSRSCPSVGRSWEAHLSAQWVAGRHHRHRPPTSRHHVAPGGSASPVASAGLSDKVPAHLACALVCPHLPGNPAFEISLKENSVQYYLICL